MAQEHFIIELFCRVDDLLPKMREHRQAKLFISELVTPLTAVCFERQFAARFLSVDQTKPFGIVSRSARTHTTFSATQNSSPVDTEKFHAEPTIFGVIDSDGIELCHPIREVRQPQRQRLGKKGFASWRWIVGGKLCVMANRFGLITDWRVMTANVPDTEFLPLVQAVDGQMIVWADKGVRSARSQPENLKICARGEWNDRMLIETIFSLFSQVCKLKHLRQRVWAYFEMRLADTVALFNPLQQWNGLNFDKYGISHLSLAEFSL